MEEEDTTIPPPPVVHYQFEKDDWPNDRWTTVTGTILIGGDSIEMHPVLCWTDELTEAMDALDFVAQKAYYCMQENMKKEDTHDDESTE